MHVPITFTPHMVAKPWGARRLAEVLGKTLPDDGPMGESWEISNWKDHESLIATGPLAGRTLGEVAADDTHAADIFGEDFVQLCQKGFPLLFKFIDADGLLSIQVHPTGERGKTKHETWIVLAVGPEGRVWRGWKPGVTEADARAAIENGTLKDCVNEFIPKVGDVVHNPAGTIHAVGGGVLFAEIQDAYPVTYRLYDWNRVDENGVGRELHVDESFSCVSWETDERHTVTAPIETLPGGTRERLVTSLSYELERWRVTETVTLSTGGTRFELLAITEGHGTLVFEGGEHPFKTGDSLLMPAALGEYKICADEPLTVLRSIPLKS